MAGLRTISDSINVFSKRQRGVLLLAMLLTVTLGMLFPLLISYNPNVLLSLDREYRAGELADRDIVSPISFSFVDQNATEAKIEAAADSVPPRFQYMLSDTIRIRRAAEQFVSDIRAGGTGGNADGEASSVTARLGAMTQSKRNFILDLILECMNDLLHEGIFSAEDLLAAEDSGVIVAEPSSVDFMYSGKEAKVSDLVTLESVGDYVIRWVTELYPVLEAGDADIIADAIQSLAECNVRYDSILTASLRYDASSSISPVLVHLEAGDYIVRMDTVITEQQLDMIEELRNAAVVRKSFPVIAGEIVFLVVFIGIAMYLLLTFISYDYRLFQYLMIFLIGADLHLTAVYFIMRLLAADGVRNVDPFVSITLIPLLATTISGRRRVGFSMTVLLASYMVLYPMCSGFSFFYFFAVTSCCLLFFHPGYQRISIIYQAMMASLATAVVTLLFSMLLSQSYFITVTNILVSIVMTVMTFILLSIIVPILEKIFNIPTAYRLHELSYTDTPTLNRLSQVAPGTFNHSKNVSEMAYSACKAVGANADLALVGGLYHDIGKAEHPEYFIENQTGRNAHDDINRTLSAAIIKSHVKLGVEKAKEAGLPQEVIDIIGEHHGNDLIKYFYNEALREAKDRSQIVREEDFRYNGRIPSTPESAIVMLADCTEAATRTIKSPNHQKYEKFIMSIIIDKITYGQLNNCRLTINDFYVIKDSFIHYLMGRDHQRIEYEREKK